MPTIQRCAAVSKHFVTLACLAVVGFSASAHGQHLDFGGSTEFVSFSSAGNAVDDVAAHEPVMSSDGRFVAFMLARGKLAPQDTSWRPDIYLRDRALGTTELISSGTNNNDDAITPTVSDDGRFVAFASQHGYYWNQWLKSYIYVRDRGTGTTKLVDEGYTPCLSADGNYLTYDVQYGNSGSAYSQVYRYNLATAVTDCMSRNSAGTVANSTSKFGSVSHDGRYVAFVSNATNLDPRAVDGQFYAYVKDTSTGDLQLASVTIDDLVPNKGVTRAMISANGRHLTFTTSANNVVPNDTNGVSDVFVRDLNDGQTVCASVSSDGAMGDQASINGSLSRTGRYIAFDSRAQNLDRFEGRNVGVYLRDLRTGMTRRITINSDGAEGAGEVNGSPRVQIPNSVTEDGSEVVFIGTGSMDESYPTTSSRQVYVRQLEPPAPFVLTFNRQGLNYGETDSKVQGKLTLDKRAKADTTFSLQSSSPNLVVPDQVTVPEGSRYIQFLASSHQPDVANYVRVVATSADGLKTGSVFVVRAVRIVDVDVSSDILVKGSEITATITLGASVEMDTPIAVQLSGKSYIDLEDFTFPSTVVVPAGENSVSFQLGASKDAYSSPEIGLQVRTGGRQFAERIVNVRERTLGSISVSPASFVGGSGTDVFATITLTAPAAPGGARIFLSSQNPNLWFDIDEVSIPVGDLSITVPLRHSATATTFTTTVGARFKTTRKRAHVTVQAPD